MEEVKIDSFHDPTSPYYGLSVKEQLMLAKIRRPKGRTPKVILRRLRKATKDDYSRIFTACVNALIYGSSDFCDVRLDRIRVTLRLVYNWRTKFDKDIPRCEILAADDWSVFCRWRVDKLLDWGYKKGHWAFDNKTLRKELWNITKNFDKVAWYNLNTIDLCVQELYEDLVYDAVSGKTPRIEKGRKRYRKNNITKKIIDKPEEVCSNQDMSNNDNTD